MASRPKPAPGAAKPRWKQTGSRALTIMVPRSVRALLTQVAVGRKVTACEVASDAVTRFLMSEDYTPTENGERMLWAEQLLRRCEHLSPCIGHPCTCGLNTTINTIDGMLSKLYRGAKLRQFVAEGIPHERDLKEKPEPSTAQPSNNGPEAPPANQVGTVHSGSPSGIHGDGDQPGTGNQGNPTDSLSLELEPNTLSLSPSFWESNWPLMRVSLHEPETWDHFKSLLRGQLPPSAFMLWNQSIQIEWLKQNSPL